MILFNIYQYTILGTILQITVTSPDLINDIITLQDSSIEAVLGKVAVTASFGAVGKLNLASTVAFYVMEGIIGQQSFGQIAASTAVDASLNYLGATAGGRGGDGAAARRSGSLRLKSGEAAGKRQNQAAAGSIIRLMEVPRSSAPNCSPDRRRRGH